VYGLPGKNRNLKSAIEVMTYITFTTALPITIAAETLTIKYQDKKYLLLNAISVIGFIQVLKNTDINPSR
jgi:hypothetical protein